MKRLWKSSLFWTAVIGSAFTVGAFEFTDNQTIALFVGGLFYGRVGAKWAEDTIKASRDIAYNEESKQYEKVK